MFLNNFVCKIFRPGITLMPQNFFTMLHFVQKMTTPSDKAAYLDAKRGANSGKAEFKYPPIEMDLKLQVFHYGIGVMMNNFIFPLVDEAMGRLVQNGIPQYFLSYIEKVVLHPLPPDDKKPKVFGVKDLGFGFYIFLVFCAISILVFLLELLIFHVKELIGLITLLKTFDNGNLFPDVSLKVFDRRQQKTSLVQCKIHKSMLNV